MSFRRFPNRSEQWTAFLGANAESVAGLERLSALLATADRFDEFLQRGVSDAGDSLLTLSSLDDLEWAFLRSLVDQYSTEWESYFDPLTYRGYHQEFERRTWVPSTLPLTEEDLAKEHLVIHFWAPWNMYDREFDTHLRPVVRRLHRSVAFRSVNIDLPSCTTDLARNEVLNVPSLAFYNHGKRHHTTVGVRPATDIECEVRDWLADSSAM